MQSDVNYMDQSPVNEGERKQIRARLLHTAPCRGTAKSRRCLGASCWGSIALGLRKHRTVGEMIFEYLSRSRQDICGDYEDILARRAGVIDYRVLFGSGYLPVAHYSSSPQSDIGLSARTLDMQTPSMDRELGQGADAH